jgi:hypothetical protein
MHIQRVATEKRFGADGARVGEKPGKMDGLHVVARQAAPRSRKVGAQLTVERFPPIVRPGIPAHVLPQVLVGGVG